MDTLQEILHEVRAIRRILEADQTVRKSLPVKYFGLDFEAEISPSIYQTAQQSVEKRCQRKACCERGRKQETTVSVGISERIKMDRKKMEEIAIKQLENFLVPVNEIVILPLDNRWFSRGEMYGKLFDLQEKLHDRDNTDDDDDNDEDEGDNEKKVERHNSQEKLFDEYMNDFSQNLEGPMLTGIPGSRTGCLWFDVEENISWPRMCEECENHTTNHKGECSSLNVVHFAISIKQAELLENARQRRLIEEGVKK